MIVGIIGIDVGTKRIGLALASPDRGFAIPLGVITRGNTPTDYEKVLEEVESREVGVIVVGMPISMNGRNGPQAKEVRKFIDNLASRTEAKIVSWDERLSTVEGDRRLREARGNRKRKLTQRREEPFRDAVAATVILQAYLDAQRWAKN